MNHLGYFQRQLLRQARARVQEFTRKPARCVLPPLASHRSPAASVSPPAAKSGEGIAALHTLQTAVRRRWFFRQCGVGLGSIALGNLLGGLLGSNAQATDSLENPLAPKPPQFAPKAKRVIFLFQGGAPSHLDLFDYKPQLEKFNGTLPPAELLKGYRAAFINPNST